MGFFKNVWQKISSKDLSGGTGHNADTTKQPGQHNAPLALPGPAGRKSYRPTGRSKRLQPQIHHTRRASQFHPSFGRKKRQQKRRAYHFDHYGRGHGHGHMYTQFNRYQHVDLNDEHQDQPLVEEKKKVTRTSIRMPIYAGLYYGDQPHGGKRDSASVDMSWDSIDSARRRIAGNTSERLLWIPQRRVRSLTMSSDESYPPGRMIRTVPSSETARLVCIRRGEVSDLNEALERVTEELLKRFTKAEAKAEERRACRALACYEPFMYKLDPSTLPLGDRLTVRRRDSLTIWRQQLPPPDEGIPDPSLPEWSLLPLDQKIPQVPAPEGFLYFHRGFLGQQLHVKTPKFMLADPQNQERVVMEPYNSLHDPHLFQYFNKPQVQKILFDQGLINAKGQVLCTAKQFNKYRMYLRSVYNLSLDEIMGQREKQQKFDFVTTKKIHTHLSKVNADDVRAKREERRRRIAEENEAKRLEALRRYENKQQQMLDRYACHLVDKVRQQVHTVIKSAARAEAHKQRMMKLEESRKVRAQQQRLAAFAKQIAAEERIQIGRRNAYEAHEIEIGKRLARKYDLQEVKMKRNDAINETLKDQQHQRAMRWQLKMERARMMIQERQRRRDERKQYLEGLVRKYFYLWLKKTRARKSTQPDINHQSTWDITRVLTEMNKEIIQKSGYKRDQGQVFFVSFMKLQQKKYYTPDENDEDGGSGSGSMAKDDKTVTSDEAADEELIEKTLQGYGNRGDSPGSDESHEKAKKKIQDSITPDELSHTDVMASKAKAKKAKEVGGRVIPANFVKKAKSLYITRKKSTRWASGAPSRMLAKTNQRYVAKTTSGRMDDARARKRPLSNARPNLESKR